jgi:hypothetical protein
MKRIVPVMVALAVAAFGQSLAFAKGGGNAAAPSVSPPANSHAMANSNGPFSTDRDFGRDRAEDRMSANPSANGQATANYNGRFSTDRDFGRDRAEDRMSAEGKAHANAKKPKKLASAKPAKPRAKPATPAIPPVENGKA